MSKPIAFVLDAFEGAMELPSQDYGTLIGLFRELLVPAGVTATELSRLYSLCYGLIAAEGPAVDLSRVDTRRAEHLIACARDTLEHTFYDPSARNRAWIAHSQARLRDRGLPIPEGLDDNHLPPRLQIPWDEATAAGRIRPFLRRLEESLATSPACHFKLSWDVARDGYPVFRRIFAGWLADLDARGIGWPETDRAISVALDLLELAESAEPISWADCSNDLLPLLNHRHPMVVAGAGRWLGALYASNGYEHDSAAPPLAEILETLRHHPNHRVAVAGGFVCGFDTGLDGLHALASPLRSSGFDLDQWVLDVLAADKHFDYLPNAQALWFYVHEHYAGDPVFVGRLLDNDRTWIAMMCATELCHHVEGMAPLLERLSFDRDANVAQAARAHLERYY